jgi:hypothetical protein
MAKMADSTGPTIVESYRDFEPPEDFRETVETLLKYVPAKYLVGLKTIVLTNRAALGRDRRRKKVWSGNHKMRVSEALGSYWRPGGQHARRRFGMVEALKFAILRFLRFSITKLGTTFIACTNRSMKGAKMSQRIGAASFKTIFP